MTTQNYFVMDATQRTAVIALNHPSASIDPRQIDSASPGSGINTNQDADGFSVGDTIPLVGQYVAPVRIVNDPQYLLHVPDMVAFILELPAALLENETIFLPDPPV